MRRTRAIIVLIVMMLLGSAGVVLANMPDLQISEVRISGNSAIAKSQLENAVSLVLSDTYFGIIPKKSSLFLPRTSIATAVSSLSHRIKEVSVDRTGLTTLEIRVIEREPVALWCGPTTIDCYFIDEAGVIFARAPEYSGSFYRRFAGRDGEGEVLGTTYLPEEKFRDLGFFLDALHTRGLESETVSLDTNDYKITLTGGTYVLIKRADPFSTALETIETILSSDEFNDRGIDGVEYLDLRFGNKIFFKRM